MLDYFYNLDDPEHFHDVLVSISSIEDQRTLMDILKMLSEKIHYGEISVEHANTLKECIIKRQSEIIESIKQKRSSGGVKKLHMSPTSVSNRAGSASVVFLIANIAITTVMYTLLFISHFLNN